mgnify:CR=1 FL=1
MAEAWMLSAKVPDTPENRERINLAMEHDFLMYEGKGMVSKTVSEWLRLLINRRLEEIMGGKV